MTAEEHIERARRLLELSEKADTGQYRTWLCQQAAGYAATGHAMIALRESQVRQSKDTPARTSPDAFGGWHRHPDD